MGSPYNGLYGTAKPSSLELDLREEMDRTLNGATDEVRKGRKGLLRRMRRDSLGDPVRCPCRDEQTDEPDRDSYCRFCLGMGFLWDEREIVYYKNEDSFQDGKGFLFYLQYDKDIDSLDYIVEVKVDRDGNVLGPVERKAIFNISEAKPYKADRGRIEFWQVRGLEERKWSVFYGVKAR